MVPPVTIAELETLCVLEKLKSYHLQHPMQGRTVSLDCALLPARVSTEAVREICSLVSQKDGDGRCMLNSTT